MSGFHQEFRQRFKSYFQPWFKRWQRIEQWEPNRPGTLHRRQPFWWGSFVTVACVLALKPLDILEPLELAAYDRMVRLQSDQAPDDRLLIVGITEEDIRNQDRWPLTDETLAQALQQLQRHRPHNIGLDLYRDIQYPPGNEQLREQLQKPNIFGITFFGDLETSYVPPAPALSEPQVGFNDLAVDNDGVVRRQLLYVALGENETYQSLALRLAVDYVRKADPAKADWSITANQNALMFGDVVLPTLSSQAGGYSNADTTGYQILLRYRSKHNAARHLSLTDVLEGNFKPEWVEGKTILMGATAPSIKDILPTPYSASIQSSNYLMPGVDVHANMVSQLIGLILSEQALLSFWPEPGELLWALGWALLGGAVGWWLKHPLILGVTTIVSLGVNGGIVLLFLHQGVWIPLALPAIASVLSTALMVAYRGFYAMYHDPLTGLPNRLMFSRYLQRTLRRNRIGAQKSDSGDVSNHSSLAVLFFDLDRFQAINESFGHHFGDRVLQTVSRRLKRGIKSNGKIARLGDDEFALLIDPVTSSKETLEIVDSLQQSVGRAITIDNQEIFATASVGVAFGQLGYVYEPEALLRDAHTATYRAKSLGKARYEVFAHGMRNQFTHRFQTETDLHRALEREELYLNYQPFIDLKTGKIKGFEALVRWNHPERGFVSPGEFIPVAEETGLIIPIGLWILKTACQQMADWQRQFSSMSSLLINVNLSAKQFNQTDLVDQIHQTLQQTQLEGHSLKLELTESMVMTDVESAISVLLSLKAINIKLGLDDFGTGYSSLSYLHRLPLDTLKIDRSFVMEMEETSEGQEIVKTIISLGHNLGMDIIAEGVELETQAQQLQQWSCEYGQGYYFAKPLSVQDAETALNKAALNKGILWNV